MLNILANRTYRHLFLAQIIALVGTGLLTVALGLLAYKLAGTNAGSVLGTALAIKMLAYVLIAPVVGAFANMLPRRAFLVAMDLVRAGVALSLPFVTQIWQIYLLIFFSNRPQPPLPLPSRQRFPMFCQRKAITREHCPSRVWPTIWKPW
jgi:MFS family permease